MGLQGPPRFMSAVCATFCANFDAHPPYLDVLDCARCAFKPDISRIFSTVSRKNAGCASTVRIRNRQARRASGSSTRASPRDQKRTIRKRGGPGRTATKLGAGDDVWYSAQRCRLGCRLILRERFQVLQQRTRCTEIRTFTGVLRTGCRDRQSNQPALPARPEVV